MIFLAVGTQFPFDRLVRGVDALVCQGLLEDDVFGQVGASAYKPKRFRVVDSLKKEAFDKYIQDAECVVSHAGMGTIMMALQYEKPLLVMPRRKEFGEVVNDHQVSLARKFEGLGCLLVAYDVEELPEKIKTLRSFVPRKRHAQTQAVVDRIASFLSDLAGGGKDG